jgi:hypothetical protein
VTVGLSSLSHQQSQLTNAAPPGTVTVAGTVSVSVTRTTRHLVTVTVSRDPSITASRDVPSPILLLASSLLSPPHSVGVSDAAGSLRFSENAVPHRLVSPSRAPMRCSGSSSNGGGTGRRRQPQPLPLLVLCLLALLPRSVLVAGSPPPLSTPQPQSEVESCTYPVGDVGRFAKDLKDDFNWLSCPPHCFQLTRHLLTTSEEPRVWGSFPYEETSSACFAAIHSGIIDEALGGIIAMYAFFPADWSNTSTQTVFPHGSHLGSYSNGVTSLPVPADRWHVPSRGEELSWAVTGRGLLFKQKRTAPFSPRIGHIHYSYAPPESTFSEPWEHHWVVGGRNATHFFNDVRILPLQPTLSPSLPRIV